MGIALVTGTSTGIGQATAVSLARRGHTVVATMRNVQAATELLKIAEIEKLLIKVSALDVDDDASVERAISQVLVEHGTIDILVNNAGVGGGGSVEEAPLSRFREVMETNFFGQLRCIKAVVPTMRSRRKGCIVNITSVAGRVALAPQAAYSASKFAFEALSECLAQEMKAFNVRVAIVEPGVIATPIFTKGRPPPNDSPYPHTRRLVAVFQASLANPVSPYVVGEKICEIVDGGSWQLRYPVGPDAQAFLDWRAGMSDEESVRFGGVSDDEYKAEVKKQLGLEIKL